MSSLPNVLLISTPPLEEDPDYTKDNLEKADLSRKRLRLSPSISGNGGDPPTSGGGYLRSRLSVLNPFKRKSSNGSNIAVACEREAHTTSTTSAGGGTLVTTGSSSTQNTFTGRFGDVRVQKVIPPSIPEHVAMFPDVAEAVLGAKILFCTDETLGSCLNLLSDTDEAWVTGRRRTEGFDWCVVELARPCVVKGIHIDTNLGSPYEAEGASCISIEGICDTTLSYDLEYFAKHTVPSLDLIGNHVLPAVSAVTTTSRDPVMATAAVDAVERFLQAREGLDNSSPAGVGGTSASPNGSTCNTWIDVLPVTHLLEQEENQHWAVSAPFTVTHLRLNLWPDGGIKRLRIFGDTKLRSLQELLALEVSLPRKVAGSNLPLDTTHEQGFAINYASQLYGGAVLLSSEDFTQSSCRTKIALSPLSPTSNPNLKGWIMRRARHRSLTFNPQRECRITSDIAPGATPSSTEEGRGTIQFKPPHISGIHPPEATIRLGCRVVVKFLEVDFRHCEGRAPLAVDILVLDSPALLARQCRDQAAYLGAAGDSLTWQALCSRQSVQAGKVLNVGCPKTSEGAGLRATHIKVRFIPDGMVSRIRVFGLADNPLGSITTMMGESPTTQSGGINTAETGGSPPPSKSDDGPDDVYIDAGSSPVGRKAPRRRRGFVPPSQGGKVAAESSSATPISAMPPSSSTNTKVRRRVTTVKTNDNSSSTVTPKRRASTTVTTTKRGYSAAKSITSSQDNHHQDDPTVAAD